MVWNINKIRSNSFIYLAQIFLCSGVLGHVEIETRDLVQKIQDVPPIGNQCHEKNGKLLGEIQYPESPPIGIRCCNGAKIINDTEIAFSPVAHYEKDLKLTFGCGPQPTLCHCLWFRRRNLRSVNISSRYKYIYLRNITEFSLPTPPTRIWDSENSVKIAVKDLKHRMKAVPKTIRCNNNHLKDLTYDGMTLAIMCSGRPTRQRYFKAKMALNEYDPMFETTALLSDGELVFKGVDGSFRSLKPFNFVYLEKKKINTVLEK